MRDLNISGELKLSGFKISDEYHNTFNKLINTESYKQFITDQIYNANETGLLSKFVTE